MDKKEIAATLRCALKELGLGSTQIADKLGVSKQSVNSYLSGSLAFGKKQASRWQEAFGVSQTWLLTGEGDIFVRESILPSFSSDATGTASTESEEESASLTPRNALSYYPDILAYASNVNFFTDDDSNRAILLKVPGYEGCIGVKVYGDSMEPTAYAGNIVAIEREPVHNIVNGEIYFVVTKEQRFIKRLTQAYDDNGHPRPTILCTSDNPDQRTYAPFYIHAGDVVAIHLVVGFISMKLYR